MDKPETAQVHRHRERQQSYLEHLRREQRENEQERIRLAREIALTERLVASLNTFIEVEGEEQARLEMSHGLDMPVQSSIPKQAYRSKTRPVDKAPKVYEECLASPNDYFPVEGDDEVDVEPEPKPKRNLDLEEGT